MTQYQLTGLASLLKSCRAVALAAAVTAVIPRQVNAQDQAPTPEERQACMEDVFRLCSNHIPSYVAILACLRSKHSSLSQQCRYVISSRDMGKNGGTSK
ncbi:hypothetical protein ACVMB0_007540 [Bradyrhizobium sp. USDA 4451]